jgi:hypothetical protein
VRRAGVLVTVLLACSEPPSNDDAESGETTGEGPRGDLPLECNGYGGESDDAAGSDDPSCISPGDSDCNGPEDCCEPESASQRAVCIPKGDLLWECGYCYLGQEVMQEDESCLSPPFYWRCCEGFTCVHSSGSNAGQICDAASPDAPCKCMPCEG